MPIRSFKDKLSSLANNEILGEADEFETGEEEQAEQPKKPKPTPRQKSAPKPRVAPKPREEPKPKPRPQPKKEKVQEKPKEKKGFGIFGKKHADKDSEPKSSKKAKLTAENDDETTEPYQDVLALLGIKEHLDLSVDFVSDDLDYIEFSQTTPLGFDFDEVTDFISRAKYCLYKYESSLAQRDRDVVKLANEVKKIEQRMMERNQEKELEKMMGGMTEVEQLLDDKMQLNVEINELRNKNKALINELDELKKTVGELKKIKKEKIAESTGLPSMPVPSDPFDDMVKTMGDYYEDEI